MTSSWARRIWAILAGVAAAAFVFMLVPHEPWYHGHRLSYWVDQLWHPEANQEDVRNALRQFGPKSAPYLFKRLRHLDSQRTKAAVWSKLPSSVQDYVPPPDETDAGLVDKIACALSLQGPPVIPQLLTALHDPNRDVQVAALRTISMLGPAADHALPEVVRLLADADVEIRVQALFAIGELGTTKAQAVPALIQILRETNQVQNGSLPYLKGTAARTLGQIGPAAKVAVPELTAMLEDREPYCRSEAVVGLWQITKDANLIARLAANLEATSEQREYRSDLSALAAIGPEARFAVPIILRTMAKFRTDLSRPVRDTLRRIDPAAVEMVPTIRPTSQTKEASTASPARQ
jgi:HEAT repeat protein